MDPLGLDDINFYPCSCRYQVILQKLVEGEGGQSHVVSLVSRQQLLPMAWIYDNCCRDTRLATWDKREGTIAPRHFRSSRKTGICYARTAEQVHVSFLTSLRPKNWEFHILLSFVTSLGFLESISESFASRYRFSYLIRRCFCFRFGGTDGGKEE